MNYPLCLEAPKEHERDAIIQRQGPVLIKQKHVID